MTKEIISHEFGGDGGKIAAGTDGANFAVDVRYPMAPVLDAVKKTFVDKLKTIPGTWDDMVIDGAWDEALQLLGLK